MRTEIGGVERYARELVARLPARSPGRYDVVAPPPRFAHGAGHVWEQVLLPVRARRAELLLSPANLAPVASARNAVVIHDVAALRHPEAYSGSYVAYQRAMLPRIARHARLVITVSEFSRRELLELLPVDPSRIRVVPGGVDERFAPGSDPAPARRRYGLEGPYVLALGTASARKNLDVLVPVAHSLAGEGFELVVAGSDRGYLRSGGETGLRRLGYVPDLDLPGLLAGASAFVMPSLHEGFGLPCLEAMACGTPVVAADAGALPDTCGDAALLVPPRDAAQIADALRRVLFDQDLRQRLRDAGLRRAPMFSWGRTAELIDTALTEALEAERSA